MVLRTCCESSLCRVCSSTQIQAQSIHIRPFLDCILSPWRDQHSPHLLNLTCESGRLWRPTEGSVWAPEGRSDAGLAGIQVVVVRLILTVGLLGFWKTSGIREP